jgi:Uma2 family endonuclease
MYNNYENEEDNIAQVMLREPASVYGIRSYTEKEYLQLERSADVRHEFYRGEIFAMAGAGIVHNIIFSNVFTGIGAHVKGSGCRPFGSDMRIHIPQNSLFTYPDISVFCNNITPSSLDADTATGPAVVVEILSPSTKAYDRGPKFKLYQAIPQLLNYVLIDSETIDVTVYSRGANNAWQTDRFSQPVQAAFISSLQLSLPLKEIYEGTLLHEQV